MPHLVSQQSFADCPKAFFKILVSLQKKTKQEMFLDNLVILVPRNV